jgi:hypothetical protein
MGEIGNARVLEDRQSEVHPADFLFDLLPGQQQAHRRAELLGLFDRQSPETQRFVQTSHNSEQHQKLSSHYWLTHCR